MSFHFPVVGPAAERLTTPDYRIEPNQLRRVLPPTWMKLGIVSVALLFAAALCLTLVSPMDEFVVVAGIVRPAESTYAFSPASGILKSVDVRDGSAVKAGQLLATLDDLDARKNIAHIEGQLAVARAELARADAELRKVTAAPASTEFLFSGVEAQRQEEIRALQENYLLRLRDLQKRGGASGLEILNLQIQLIASEALLKRNLEANRLLTGEYGQAVVGEVTGMQQVLKAKIAAMESDLQLAKEELQRLEIRASTAGTVISTAVRHPGERVDVGARLFKIMEQETPELLLFAGEDRIDRVSVGQTVRFRSNNNPDRLAPLALAKITEVAKDRSLDGEESSRTASTPAIYEIEADIISEPYPLAVGASVEAEILLGRRPFWQLLLQKSAKKGQNGAAGK